MIIKEIREELYRKQDTKYRDFQSKLIPTVLTENIIGVRTPEIRKIAKKIIRRDDINDFLQALPHRFFDEDQVHALAISEIKDMDRCLEQLGSDRVLSRIRLG